MTFGPEIAIGAAVALDLALGDPQWLPHPVRLMGAVASRVEGLLHSRAHRSPRSQERRGVAAWCMVVLPTMATGLILVAAASFLHPVFGIAVSAILAATCLAARDLARHAMIVYRALCRGNLDLARERAGWMVSRSTDGLDASETARAVIESVAENIVDGVISPLFYLIIGGPVAGLGYKAVNTLDSMFGYKNDRYMHFGRFSARMDDLVNWIPARISGVLVVCAAGLCGLSARQAWRIMRRDASLHESPNAGITECAVAGALRVRLGGPSSYHDRVVHKPYLGDPHRPIAAGMIPRTVALMFVSSALAAVVGLTLRIGIRLAMS